MDLGILQVAVNLAPVQEFARAHPLYYAAGAFMAGAMLPALWEKFLTKWAPAGVLSGIKFLRARGMTTAQLKELDRLVESIDRTIDEEVAREEKEPPPAT